MNPINPIKSIKPLSRSPIETLVREWRIAKAKQELATAQADGEEEVDRATETGCESVWKIEDAIASAAPPESADDCISVLNVVSSMMRENEAPSDAENDRRLRMLNLVRHGLVGLANKSQEARPAAPWGGLPPGTDELPPLPGRKPFNDRAVMDLESDLHDLGHMHGVICQIEDRMFGDVASDNRYVFTREQIEQLAFSLNQFGRMLTAFKQSYFDAVGLQNQA